MGDDGPVRRLLTVVVALIVALALGAGVFVFITVRAPFPDVTGERTLSGLTDDVVISRDDHGIARVEASHENDLFFGQGYVHAQDRFFEMDFRRHVTAGRLSELVGDGALETDQFVRTLGWRRVAEQEFDLLDGRTQRMLRAYARGVNAYIEDRGGSALSLEYSLLTLTGPEYRPEPWNPVDSLAWIKAMSWDLRSNMSDEIGRVLATEKLTIEQVEQLWPDYPDDHATIVDSADLPTSDAPSDEAPPVDVQNAAAAVQQLGRAQRAAEALPALLGTGEGIGSNSWVVDGSRTTTGKPILANDPHLAPSMPGIWYQVGLRCRTVTDDCPYDVAGFSFSGLPGVVVGHNRRVAWGVTTMYADVADLYLERVTGDTYEFEGEQLPLETREETFEIAEADPVTITVRETRHGPLLSDLDENIERVGQGDTPTVETGDRAVALRWTALTPRPTIKAVFALGEAQDWQEFRAAAELFTVPSQNLVYADVDGNIGYQSPGAIPVRSRGDGRWPVPGWTGEYEWTGEIPFDELPSVLNPDGGAIVTANNRVVDDGYPYLLGADTAAGYRSDRILQLLEGRDDLDVEAMTAMQTDTLNGNAERLVPYLLDVPLDAFATQGQDTMRDWDLTQPPDSAAAAFFNATWRHLLEITFADDLPPAARPDGGERWFNVLDRIIDEPDSPWWDDRRTVGVVEDREIVLREAMRRARDELTSRQSLDPAEWSWGRLHRLDLVNQTLGTSGIGPVEALFNRGPYELGGGSGIVDATGWDAREGYEVTAVPSMRMVVDLDNLDRSRWIQLTGASGHAFHEHYTDQTELWARGETLAWPFTSAAVAAAAERVLVLRAAG